MKGYKRCVVRIGEGMISEELADVYQSFLYIDGVLPYRELAGAALTHWNISVEDKVDRRIVCYFNRLEVV